MRFIRRSAALFVVAAPAGGNDILPCLLPAFGDRDHMIEGKILGSVLSPAILTAIAVTGKNINAGELHGTMRVPNLDHFQKTDDGRKLDCDGDAMDLPVIDFEDLDLALP